MIWHMVCTNKGVLSHPFNTSGVVLENQNWAPPHDFGSMLSFRKKYIEAQEYYMGVVCL